VKIIKDLWLCTDCVQIAVNDDASGLDYYYEPDEAARRLREIEAGLEALPGLTPDDQDGQMECRECGHISEEGDFLTVVENEGTDDEESFRSCPACHSYDTEPRDSGTEEFSRRECDCCGTDLAGSRMRFAQLIEEEKA